LRVAQCLPQDADDELEGVMVVILQDDVVRRQQPRTRSRFFFRFGGDGHFRRRTAHDGNSWGQRYGMPGHALSYSRKNVPSKPAGEWSEPAGSLQGPRRLAPLACGLDKFNVYPG